MRPSYLRATFYNKLKFCGLQQNTDCHTFETDASET